MTVYNLGRKAMEAASGSSAAPTITEAVAAPEQVNAFNGALDEARRRLEPVQFTTSSGGPAAPDLRRETIRALDLAPTVPSPASTPGDAILSGLSKLQGEFRGKQKALVDTMSVGSASANDLMKLQMDMVQYTLMIDVASKITGKVTQSVDSLVKGQ